MNKPNDLSFDYIDLYERFIVEASFLWLQRSMVVDRPHYTRSDIQELEGRIQAQLDGLMTHMDMAWPLCEKAIELNGPGEVFTATILAFRSADPIKIQKVVEAGLAAPECTKALVSAIAWLPPTDSQPWIQNALSCKDTRLNYIAICLYSIRRENPGDVLAKYLLRDAFRQDEKLHARCLRLLGEIKRRDLRSTLSHAAESENESASFWANWSASLLGDKKAVHQLEPHLFKTSVYQERAMQVVFRVVPVSQARQWIAQLATDPQHGRAAIKAAGIAGDPYAVDGLIEKMKDPRYARLAGETFTLITGIDLEQNRSNSGAPPDYLATPNDDAHDPMVAMDEDEYLAWPNAALVAARWQQIAGQRTKGQRYLLGKEINTRNLLEHLQTAFQRQRHAAAMELALLDTSHVLTNTRSKVSQA